MSGGDRRGARGASRACRWPRYLDRAGVRSGAEEVVFRGADAGTVAGRRDVRFERSLRLDAVRDADALLAYAMNGEPLPIHHGYPLRLVVPSWYAVALVKWLTDIEVIDRPFTGHYQSDKYWYEWPQEAGVVREPVTLQRMRALITDPTPGQEIPSGEMAVRGVAWSGVAPIARVEVSVEDGNWQDARLVGESRQHSWQSWELFTRVQRASAIAVRARATDLAGQTQPECAEWNRLGYGNNAIHEVPVRIV